MGAAGERACRSSLESGEGVCGRGIKPALEEQKPALGMERFPRQAGMAGLSVQAGALVCRHAVLLSTRCPSHERK